MCRACFAKAAAHLTKEDVEQALRLIDGMNQEQFDAYTEALREPVHALKVGSLHAAFLGQLVGNGNAGLPSGKGEVWEAPTLRTRGELRLVKKLP
jgi:hypothetical protein